MKYDETYCERKNCFAYYYGHCKCLDITSDTENCPFFKSRKQFFTNCNDSRFTKLILERKNRTTRPISNGDKKTLILKYLDLLTKEIEKDEPDN